MSGEMQVGGFLVGALAGSFVTAGMATGRAVNEVAAQQRAMSTIGRWQNALASARLRAIRAEHQVARQALEIDQLRAALSIAELELAALRGA